MKKLKNIENAQLWKSLSSLCLSPHLDLPKVADAIRNMVVRGAPAIGITAAYGMAIAQRNGEDLEKVSMTQKPNQLEAKKNHSAFKW